jgi:hypothetical protein
MQAAMARENAAQQRRLSQQRASVRELQSQALAPLQ